MLEFKRMQLSAELKMLVYYFEMLAIRQTSQIMKFSSMPCATLEVVGNELRFAPYLGYPLDLPAALPFVGMQSASAVPCAGWACSGMRRLRVLLDLDAWSCAETPPWKSGERALHCCALSCTW